MKYSNLVFFHLRTALNYLKEQSGYDEETKDLENLINKLMREFE